VGDRDEDAGDGDKQESESHIDDFIGFAAVSCWTRRSPSRNLDASVSSWPL